MKNTFLIIAIIGITIAVIAVISGVLISIFFLQETYSLYFEDSLGNPVDGDVYFNNNYLGKTLKGKVFIEDFTIGEVKIIAYKDGERFENYFDINSEDRDYEIVFEVDFSQDSSIKINLITEKDQYEIFEPFNITLTKEYTGDEFQAIITYKFQKENHGKIFYKGYIINLSNEKLNRNKGHEGYPGDKAFNIEKRENSNKENYMFPLEYFTTEGNYIISVYLYSCKDIEEHGYKCYLQNSLSYIMDENEKYHSNPEILVENVEPLVSTSKTIIVKGGENPAECSTNSDCSQKSDKSTTGTYQCFLGTTIPKCIECNGDASCKDGYSCFELKCVKDECNENSDCTEYCEGCQDNSMICKRGQCVQCDKFRHKCNKGYICEDWGCTSVEILKEKKDCELGEICGSSESRITPEYKCTMSSASEKNEKCLECWGDAFCKEEYNCYNYECVIG